MHNTLAVVVILFRTQYQTLMIFYMKDHFCNMMTRNMNFDVPGQFLLKYISVYVCTRVYVCMHVCTYVCVCVCM
jgi:hypothetical protein